MVARNGKDAVVFFNEKLDDGNHSRYARGPQELDCLRESIMGASKELFFFQKKTEDVGGIRSVMNVTMPVEASGSLENALKHLL